MESLVSLFRSYTGNNPVSCNLIAGGGSRRQYYRLTDKEGNNVIGSIGTSREENDTFVYLAEHFAKHQIPVPTILAVNADGLSYLQSDLGTTTLYEALKGGRESTKGYGAEDVALLERVVRMLPKIQIKGAEDLDFAKCYPQPVMDEQSVMFDLNYFKYCFLKTTGIEFDEMKLEQSFHEMSQCLGSFSVQPYFLYRDFQARNVMLDAQGNPFFIDFQGGRRGALQYDLVSFLWQASSHFSSELRQHLINEYITSLKRYIEIDETAFRNSIPQWVLFRTLQVLGAYGLRGRFERKKYFLDSIPAAIKNLQDLLAVPEACPYQYLYKVLSEMVVLPEFIDKTSTSTSPSVSCYENQGSLKVTIYSFSYKKGIPQDASGNGGGYVFDCRSTHNPGRYEPYKQLTGLDYPVIDFLEKDGEICTFLSHVYELADAHVQRYIQRGFTSLMFCFGCTGGQHRSVYSAQHLAEHLNNKFGIEVQLIHREQDTKTHFAPRRKAMIFAAGLGTRLKPLTETMPKALVPVNGKPLIEHIMEKLVSNGFNDIVINVHHFADMVENWAATALQTKYKNLNVSISISDERANLLDTGGALAHAEQLLTSHNSDSRVLIHNVDIISNADLGKVWQHAKLADAVLLVSARKTTRYLIFDEEMRLVGWTNTQTGEVRSPYPEVRETSAQFKYGKYHLKAFAGIHCIRTSLLAMMHGYSEKFSIIDFYINVCNLVNIRGCEQNNLQVTDVGKVDTLQGITDNINT